MNDPARLRQIWAERKAVSRTRLTSEVVGLPLDRRHFRPRLLSTVKGVAPPLALIFALADVLAYFRIPLWQLGLVGLLEGALTVVFLYFAVVAYSSFAVLRTDAGLVVYEDHIVSSKLVEYPVPWAAITGVRLARKGGTDVNLHTSGLPVFLDEWQARAVLTDPRCPLSGQLPDDVVARLHLTRESPPETRA